jgi:ubiquinol-cytochrome c reductase cytochrome c1 subunit
VTIARSVFRLIAVGLFGLTANAALAQHAEAVLEPANVNVANTPSVQRGAKYFVNYCMGCHSAKYVRYNRLAEDLQISEDALVRNLMFTGERPHDTMAIAMRPADAQRWFGITPPDLSLIARSRGTDYIYTFLRSFYEDPTSPTGADNLVLPGTAMPHVLWELQGIQRLTTGEAAGEGDAAHGESARPLELAVPGQLSPREFDQVVRDIVNFLAYIAEPMKLERQALGIRVIAFLLVFLLIAWMLKREIWKDVH